MKLIRKSHENEQKAYIVETIATCTRKLFSEKTLFLITVDYRLSTHFFWYAPRLKYALIQKDEKKKF